jgi:hypothetical protein
VDGKAEPNRQKIPPSPISFYLSPEDPSPFLLRPLLISTEEEKNGALQDDRFGQVSKMNEFIS